MNNLNSIIYEGKVYNKPIFEGNKAYFDVQSKHTYKNQIDEIIEDSTVLPCVLAYRFPSHVAMLKEGRGIRLVGYVANYNNKLVIIVEHLEYKPEYKKVAN